MAELTRLPGESEADFKKRMSDASQNTDVSDGLSLDRDSAAYKEMVAERQGKDAEQQKREAQGKKVIKGAMKAADVAHKVHTAGKVASKVAAKTALFPDGSIGLTGNIAEQLSDTMTTETAEEKAARLAKRRDAKIPKSWSEPQKEEEGYIPRSLRKYM